MAAGTLVVAVDAPGAVDVLDACGGLLTKADDRALADVALSVLSVENRRNELAQEALSAVQHFNIPDATQRLSAAYETALQDYPTHT